MCLLNGRVVYLVPILLEEVPNETYISILIYKMDFSSSYICTIIHQNTLQCEKFGFFPLNVSFGVTKRSPTIVELFSIQMVNLLRIGVWHILFSPEKPTHFVDVANFSFYNTVVLCCGHCIYTSSFFPKKRLLSLVIKFYK